MITRKLKDRAAREKLEEKMEDAAAYGYSFIELRLSNPSQYKESIIGLESFRITTSRRAGDMYSTTSGVNVVSDGEVVFYPDSRKICWGYMLDTAKNRRWLAAQLKTQTVTILDRVVKKEIDDLAKKEGFVTEVVIGDKTLDNYLNKSEVKKADLDLKNEVEELRARLAELEAEEPKPLTGKKITRKKSE